MLKQTLLILVGGVICCITCSATTTYNTNSPYQRINKLVHDIQTSQNNFLKTELLNQLLEEYENYYTATSEEYAECLLWCANICADCGDHKQSRALMRHSESIFKQYGSGMFNGRDTLAQLFLLDLRAKIEDKEDRTYHASRHMHNSLRLKKEYFGDKSEIYLVSLLDLSRIYAHRLLHSKSNYYHNLGYNSYVERIKTEFCSTCESKRITYWTTAAQYINRTLDLAYKSIGHGSKGNDSSLASAAYNATLLYKGLLLNTSRSFEKHVIESGNEEAMEILKTKKYHIDHQAPQSTIDSLDYMIIHALNESGHAFNLPLLDINWQDISSQLGKDDLAIEFYRTDGGQYGAILLKKGWRSPKLVKLKQDIIINKKRITLENGIKQIHLDKYTEEQAENLWNISRAIWTDDIIEHFPYTTNGKVYFAADGELLIHPIESLPFILPKENNGYIPISDLYNIYRLSSTRELAIDREICSNPSVAIYGGIRYDMDYDDMVADARNNSTNSINDTKNEYLDTIRATGGLPYLVGTRIEADSIANTIRQSKTITNNPRLYIGTKGTESSIKALSGSDIHILHIATHGYYFEHNDQVLKQLKLGDNSLCRSGLIFAGADNKWFGDELPKGIDDGFLTALEISTLDFHNLDLVALSACETGTGSIEDDGVYGLQRGFKMAGVNSILMSLWKVDDRATCRLMIEFYKNWVILGLTKHDALEKAKKTIRSYKTRGWDNPYYWAAFILLDGIN